MIRVLSLRNSVILFCSSDVSRGRSYVFPLFDRGLIVCGCMCRCFRVLSSPFLFKSRFYSGRFARATLRRLFLHAAIRVTDGTPPSLSHCVVLCLVSYVYCNALCTSEPASQTANGSGASSKESKAATPRKSSGDPSGKEVSAILTA